MPSSHNCYILVVIITAIDYYCAQIKKGIFRLGRGDGKEDLICPIDPSRENRQRTHVNGAVLCSYEDSPQEIDEVWRFQWATRVNDV